MLPSHLQSTLALVKGALSPPPGRGRITLAVAYGLTCHLIFLAGTGSMIVAMYFGMSESLGAVPWPWAAGVNALLLLQFPLVHSALLSKSGRALLARLAPDPHGQTLATTTYAIIAGFQLLILYVFWTPSGIIWWQAEGAVRVLLTCLYASSWLLLAWSDINSGVELQTGALGWLSLVQKRSPDYPDMPTGGPFRVIRQPIYLAFALTLWTVSTWTPDQLVIAATYTAYCILAPRLKERRFRRRYGERFRRYQSRTPYMVPGLKGARDD